MQNIYDVTQSSESTGVISPQGSCLCSSHYLFRQVLEADKSFGAEKFTLYLHSASPEVLAIIRHYVTSGVMEAVEWRLPFTDVSLVHYFGQMAAINDCLYNSQYTSRYVVFHDFDELLFPRMHDTWNQMLEEIQLQVSLELFDRIYAMEKEKEKNVISNTVEGVEVLSFDTSTLVLFLFFSFSFLLNLDVLC